MKRNLLILAIILLIGFIVNSCSDDEETPVSQSKTFYNVTTENGTVNVIVNYTALPGSTPGYVSLLEEAFRGVLPYYNATGDLTINVIIGDSGLTKTGSKTLSVGESWFTGKTQNDLISAFISIGDAWGQ